jgi:hypothetical protein
MAACCVSNDNIVFGLGDVYLALFLFFGFFFLVHDVNVLMYDICNLPLIIEE